MKRNLAVLLLAASFFPYPSLVDIGSSVGLALFTVLSLLVLLLNGSRILAQPSAAITLILVVAALASTVATIPFKPGFQMTSLGFSVTLTLFLVGLPVSEWAARSVSESTILLTFSILLVANLLLCLFQLRSFAGGSIPFVSLYRNPSFADISAISHDYALYVRRPFGFFPEPSAMASVVGPWALFLFHRAPSQTRSIRFFCFAGAFAGLGALVVSGSAFLVVVAPLLGALIMMRSKNDHTSSMARVGTLILGAFALVYLLLSRSDRISASNSSTLARYSSLQDGLGLPLQNWHDLLFGVGPGLSGRALAAANSYNTEIYSVTIKAWAEGGILWFLCAVAICLRLANRRLSVPLKICLTAWALGLTVSTSYYAMGATWSFLGILLAHATHIRKACPDEDRTFNSFLSHRRR